MDDLISRQEAIDAICKACSMEEDYHKCDGYPETSTWCDELGALRALPSAQPKITLESAIDYLRSIGWLQEHDKALSSAEPEQQWIPCSERLPNNTGLYLITIKLLNMSGKWRGDVTIGARNFNANKRSWFGVKQDDVIAWMPLPDAYEEDGR